MPTASSPFGFSVDGLYRLSTEQLLELAGYVRDGEDAPYTPPDKDVIIRGVLVPFLREAGDVERDATHAQIMRSALIATAKALGAEYEDWDSLREDQLISSIKIRLRLHATERFQGLPPEEQQKILDEAESYVQRDAADIGIGLIPTAAIIAGQSTGFGIYLATTTGLSALSTAIGVTLPFAAYQGATTALGVMLGPVGWIVAGSAITVQIARVWGSRRERERRRKLVTLVIATIYAVGDDPFAFFGIPVSTPPEGPEQLNHAYRAIVKTIHSDLVHDDAPEWMKHQLNVWLISAAEHRDRLRAYFTELEEGA